MLERTKVTPFNDEEDADKDGHDADEAGREFDNFALRVHYAHGRIDHNAGDKSSRREWVRM
jgi:hypothetical protein